MTIDRNVFSKTHCALIITYVFYRYWDVFTRRFQIYIDLATMKQAGEPLNAGKIAELSGLDRKEVDKAMKELKAEGAIVSPVRCKWAPAE